MNLLSVEQLSKTYGSKVLFDKISFGINQGDKVALIAKNGAGKTTLINILKGKEVPDAGKVVFRKEIRVAFLDQDPVLDLNLTVMETLLKGDNPFTKALKRYTLALEAHEQNSNKQTEDELDEATQEITLLNAWDAENQIKTVASRLGLDHFSQSVSTLSGGQKKRLALANIIITEPDLLVLDEPTNHLDIEMIEWLEHYLSSKDLSLLLVTHDRYFLNEVCSQIIEIDDHKLYSFQGDYHYYIEKKEEMVMAQNSEIDKARNLYRRELEWMRKMPRARGTKAKSRITSFYETEEKAKQKQQDNKIELSVKMNRLGSKIVELIKVSKAFGDKVLLDKFTYTFCAGDKIGIVGKNGSGKSTLLNMLLGTEHMDSGKIQTGETVIFGYYSQQGMQLKEEKRIIEVVKDIGEFIPLANGSSLSASHLLTRFNFPPDVQYSFVSKLSGGEKRRLYLLTILMKNPNFLILDEPTNDLDIATLQTLEEFLFEFKGCVLIVSHDRYFLDKLVNHVFAFEGGGEIKDFPGNYTEYRNYKDEQLRREKQKQKPEISKKEDNVASNVQTPKSESKKLSYKEQRELDGIEGEIQHLENEKRDLENKLLNAEALSHEVLSEMSKRIGTLTEAIDIKTIRWLELQEKNSN